MHSCSMILNDQDRVTTREVRYQWFPNRANTKALESHCSSYFLLDAVRLGVRIPVNFGYLRPLWLLMLHLTLLPAKQNYYFWLTSGLRKTHYCLMVPFLKVIISGVQICFILCCSSTNTAASRKCDADKYLRQTKQHHRQQKHFSGIICTYAIIFYCASSGIINSRASILSLTKFKPFMATPSLSTSSLGRVERENEGGGCYEETLKKQHLHLVSVLPAERGWLSERIHLYQGFWYSTISLMGLLALQQRFESQPSDILLASYPKSGTTWLKALLFTLTNPTCLDHPARNPLLAANPHELVPFLEFYAVSNPTHPRPKSSLMNTHIPYSSLPESIKLAASGCRIVYVFRDPKDVLVSFWHFVNKVKPDAVAQISLEDAFEQFRRGASTCGPYWDHVLGYCKASIERPDRVFLIRYEDLKKEPLFHTKRLSEFLGHPLVEEEEGGESLQAVRKVVDFCSFETLRDLEVNKTGSHSAFALSTNFENKMFFRRGEIGDSRNHLTREMMDELDEIARQKWKEFPDLINTISV